MADLITLASYKDAEGLSTPKEDLRISALIPSVSQLVNNLSTGDHRPLISKQKDLYKFVKSQLVLREPIYLHSDYVIDMNTDHENKLFNLLKTLF